MKMNRRSFFTTLAAFAVIDPERLIWKPRKKLISIPKPMATADAGSISGSITVMESWFKDNKGVVWMDRTLAPLNPNERPAILQAERVRTAFPEIPFCQLGIEWAAFPGANHIVIKPFRMVAEQTA